ncbi:hypothetical protein H0H93_013094 [Arthromyces matolae]|nr:hypothetical protein H0H93_013094 [Arthromyces matolae]
MPDRTVAAMWQLTNTYMLLGLLEAFGFRAIRDTLADNPAAQERLLGASMMSLAFADVSYHYYGFGPPTVLIDALYRLHSTLVSVSIRNELQTPFGSVGVSLIAAPADIRFDVAKWNGMSHGNITFVIVLCLVRLAWFAGIGRTRYYFGQPGATRKERLA